MKVSVSIFNAPDEIEVQPQRAEGRFNLIGDGLHVVKPGGEAFGLSYEAWLKLGDGVHEILEDGTIVQAPEMRLAPETAN